MVINAKKKFANSIYKKNLIRQIKILPLWFYPIYAGIIIKFIPVKALLHFAPPLFLFFVLFLVGSSSFQHLLHPGIWYIFLFFTMVHLLVVRLADMGFERGNFINFYLASTVIRIVLILIFTGVFLWLFPENRKLFLLTAVVFYLFFTIFEISILLRKLRRF